MKLVTAVVLFLLSVSEGTTSWGPCPSVSLQPNFSISSYMGTWYELLRSKDMPWEQGNCNEAHYTLNTDGTVSVINSQVVNGTLSDISGSVTCLKNNPPHCAVKFASVAGPAGDYEVFETDYTNYSIVYSCTGIGIAHSSWVWILARDPEFDFEPLLPKLQSLGFPSSSLYFTAQNNCPTSFN